MAERRNFVRIQKRLEVAYRVIVERYANDSIPQNITYTDTISGNGMTMYSPKPIDKGVKLEMELTLDDKEGGAIEITGEVIGCDKKDSKQYDIKVKFIDVDDPVIDRLASYVIRQGVKAKKDKK